MKKYLKVLILFVIITVIMGAKSIILADVGSFETYDGGGSSWGSSSSSDSWSSSSSSSSWGSGRSSYSSGSSSSWGSSSSGYSSSSGLGISPTTICIILVILILFIILKSKDEQSKDKQAEEATRILVQRVEREPEIYQGPVEEKIKEIDELFNAEEFNQKAKTLFIKMQNAWTDRNWEEIRPFETDALFEQHKMQIDGHIRNNTINVMDRICVLYSKLLSFEQTGDKDVLNVVIKSRMADYIIDATTKKVVRGDKSIERENFYRLEFIRKTGVKTKPEEAGLNTTNCPNCGAPTKITSSGQCEYCKSIITTGEFGWVLNNLEPYKF